MTDSDRSKYNKDLYYIERKEQRVKGRDNKPGKQYLKNQKIKQEQVRREAEEKEKKKEEESKKKEEN